MYIKKLKSYIHEMGEIEDVEARKNYIHPKLELNRLKMSESILEIEKKGCFFRKITYTSHYVQQLSIKRRHGQCYKERRQL